MVRQIVAAGLRDNNVINEHYKMVDGTSFAAPIVASVVAQMLEANPDLKQSELARATQLDRSTVVTVIDNLERRGLVERRVALHDRRSNAIRLTAAGTALLRKLKRQVSQHEKRLLENFSEAERASFIALLRKVFPQHR